MVHAAKVDAVQAGIVDALRRCGAEVETLANVGRGVPDLLVLFAGQWTLLEVKSPGGKLTPLQRIWHRRFAGGRLAVVRDPVEALAAIGARVEQSTVGGVDH